MYFIWFLKLSRASGLWIGLWPGRPGGGTVWGHRVATAGALGAPAAGHQFCGLVGPVGTLTFLYRLVQSGYHRRDALRRHLRGEPRRLPGREDRGRGRRATRERTAAGREAFAKWMELSPAFSGAWASAARCA